MSAISQLLAQLRAIEQRRFLVRATTTGISAVIAPSGDRAARAPSGEEATLSARTSLLSGATLYQRIGDAPWWLALVVAAAWASREAVLKLRR